MEDFDVEAKKIIGLRDALVATIDESKLLERNPDKLDEDLRKFYYQVKRFTVENRLEELAASAKAKIEAENNYHWNKVDAERRDEVFGNQKVLSDALSTGQLDQYEIHVPDLAPVQPPAPPINKKKRAERPPPPPSTGLLYDEPMDLTSSTPSSVPGTASMRENMPATSSAVSSTISSTTSPAISSTIPPAIPTQNQIPGLFNNNSSTMAVFSDDSPDKPSLVPQSNINNEPSVWSTNAPQTNYIPPTFSGTFGTNNIPNFSYPMPFPAPPGFPMMNFQRLPPMNLPQGPPPNASYPFVPQWTQPSMPVRAPAPPQVQGRRNPQPYDSYGTPSYGDEAR